MSVHVLAAHRQASQEVRRLLRERKRLRREADTELKRLLAVLRSLTAAIERAVAK